MAYYQYVNVPVGETLHLRSAAEKNSSNVITELPRGQAVVVLYAMSDFRRVRTSDCINELEGFVDSAFLTSQVMDVAESQMYIPRYSTPAWKRSSHYNKEYLPVKRIQEDLRSIGYTSVGTADGFYGQNTENAVKLFQTNNGLAADGVFGNNSKKKLWDLIDRRG